jgi:hypothetical protein
VLQGIYQPDLWPRDATLSDRHRLTLPADLPPGRYRLDLGLYPSGQPGLTLPVEGGDRLPLAMLTIGEVTAPPSPATLAGVTFGDQIRLLGYDLQRDDGGPQPTIRLTLHWQAIAPVNRTYTVFVHLLDAGGAIVTQDDALPGDPFFPTSTWLPDEIVLDSHLLALPGDAPTGDYTLLAGLYHRPSGERLQAVDAYGNSLGDAIQLEPIPAAAESP